MMLHLHQTAEQGHTKDDTDVVILAVYHFHKLCFTEIWVGFGYGKALKEISIHNIFQQVRTQ
jgi:hypothetical protein